MVRLDSIKIKAPTDVLNGFNADAFDRNTKTKSGIIVKDTSEIKDVYFGFNNCTINNLTNDFTIEVSAKILGSDYAEGININTYDRLIDTVNSHKILNINSDAFYNVAEVLRADVTDNVKIDYKGDIYSDLSIIPLPNKYEVTPYSTTRNKGVVFKGKQKSFKERQIMYDKLIELSSVRQGKQFLNSVNKHKIYNDFKNTVRVEGNFTSFDTMRKYIGSNKFSDVLNSDAKVNFQLFNKIVKQAVVEVLHLFDKYDGMTLKEVIRRRGLEGIITDAKYNWNYIDLWLKNKAPKNYRRARKEFRAIYLELQTKQQKNNGVHVIKIFSDALSKVA